MRENKLTELSMDFSVDIINLVKRLKSNHESIISNQIGRSGTSIGANIHEAQYAQGKKDFISKLEIALKEASETGYWLELLFRTKYIDEQTFKELSSKCTSIRVMLITSCKTAKENSKCKSQVPSLRPTKKSLLSIKTKVTFLNDVCLRQMMLATPMMLTS